MPTAPAPASLYRQLEQKLTGHENEFKRRDAIFEDHATKTPIRNISDWEEFQDYVAEQKKESTRRDANFERHAKDMRRGLRELKQLEYNVAEQEVLSKRRNLAIEERLKQLEQDFADQETRSRRRDLAVDGRFGSMYRRFEETENAVRGVLMFVVYVTY